MDGHVNDQPSAEAPTKGLRVRLVGGVADGRTVIVSNSDDVRFISVPSWADEGGLREVRYRRVIDKQGLRYVHTEDWTDIHRER